MEETKKIKILFVCLGNICRSPAAEGIFKKLAEEAGCAGRFAIDSAGLTGYHEGELPDPRMRSHAVRRGYLLDSRSRPVRLSDFETYDYLIGMDDRNYDELRRLAPDPESAAKVHRMVEYCRRYRHDHVPDPYYEGADGFELVLDLLEDACAGLLDVILSSDRDS